jgi:hypothetical protein
MKINTWSIGFYLIDRSTDEAIAGPFEYRSQANASRLDLATPAQRDDAYVAYRGKNGLLEV